MYSSKFARSAFLVFSLFLLLFLPVKVMAQTSSIDAAEFEIPYKSLDRAIYQYQYDTLIVAQVYLIEKAGNYAIRNVNCKGGIIVITANEGEVNLTLDNVSFTPNRTVKYRLGGKVVIENGEEVKIRVIQRPSIITILGNCTTKIHLEGKNTLVGGSAGAAIANYGHPLIIDGDGELYAEGGGGAGIGGSLDAFDVYKKSRIGANITINGGTITAKGSSSYPGIGGRGQYTDDLGVGYPAEKFPNGMIYYFTHDITINGGNITAIGGVDGAGIGGGNKTVCRDIYINGGVIDAQGGAYGAGIGTGSFFLGDGDQYKTSNPIYINGGVITAQGGIMGAGIGAGYDGSASDIHICGGDIKAYAGEKIENGGNWYYYRPHAFSCGGYRNKIYYTPSNGTNYADPPEGKEVLMEAGEKEESIAYQEIYKKLKQIGSSAEFVHFWGQDATPYLIEVYSNNYDTYNFYHDGKELAKSRFKVSDENSKYLEANAGDEISMISVSSLDGNVMPGIEFSTLEDVNPEITSIERLADNRVCIKFIMPKADFTFENQTCPYEVMEVKKYKDISNNISDSWQMGNLKLFFTTPHENTEEGMSKYKASISTIKKKLIFANILKKGKKYIIGRIGYQQLASEPDFPMPVGAKGGNRITSDEEGCYYMVAELNAAGEPVVDLINETAIEQFIADNEVFAFLESIPYKVNRSYSNATNVDLNDVSSAYEGTKVYMTLSSEDEVKSEWYVHTSMAPFSEVLMEDPQSETLEVFEVKDSNPQQWYFIMPRSHVLIERIPVEVVVNSEHEVQIQNHLSEALHDDLVKKIGEKTITMVDLMDVTDLTVEDVKDFLNAAAASDSSKNLVVYLPTRDYFTDEEKEELKNLDNVIWRDDDYEMHVKRLRITDAISFPRSIYFKVDSAVYKRKTPAPAGTRAASTNRYYSLSLPYGLAKIPAGVKVEKFVSADLENATVTFERVSEMEANMPYIFSTQLEEVDFSTTETIANTYDTNAADEFQPNYEFTQPGEIEGWYALRSDGSGFGRCNASAYLVPFRSALKIEKAGAKMLRMLTDETTSVENPTEKGCLKITTGNGEIQLQAFVNDQQVKVYNAAGANLANITLNPGKTHTLKVIPGTYVINGTKVTIK